MYLRGMFTHTATGDASRMYNISLAQNIGLELGLGSALDKVSVRIRVSNYAVWCRNRGDRKTAGNLQRLRVCITKM